MTQEPEPLVERVLVCDPQSTKRVLQALASWLPEANFPFILDIRVLILRDGPVEIVLTGKTSAVEAIYDDLYAHLVGIR